MVWRSFSAMTYHFHLFQEKAKYSVYGFRGQLRVVTRPFDTVIVTEFFFVFSNFIFGVFGVFGVFGIFGFRIFGIFGVFVVFAF